MELIDARIDFFINGDRTEIVIHDAVSSLRILEITLTPVQLSQAMGRLSMTKCAVFVNEYSLDKLNRKLEVSQHEFEIPDFGYDKRNKKKDVFELAVKSCPDGWQPDNYFESQGSFFTKDNKQYARCTIRRWI